MTIADPKLDLSSAHPAHWSKRSYPLGIALARLILSLLLIPSPTLLPPLAPSRLLRPYPFPLPLLRNSSLFLDALFFLILRALLAFALICNELRCSTETFLLLKMLSQ